MRRAALGLALAAVVTTLTLVAEPASACSCARRPLRQEIEAAEAVVLGRAAPEAPPFPGLPRRQGHLRFDVDHVVKGDVPPTVEVEFESGCVAPGPPRGRVGLYLARERGGWKSNDCQVRDVAGIARAVAPLPPPDGSGPATFVASGRLKEARFVLLDGEGRPLGYGVGGGSTAQLSICPGGRRAVEMMREDEPLAAAGPFRPPLYRLVTWDLATLQVIGRSELHAARAVSCRDEEGDEVWMAAGAPDDAANRVLTLVHLRDGERRRIDVPPSSDVTFHSRLDTAYLTTWDPTEGAARKVAVVDLTTGVLHTVGTVSRDASPPFPSPAGTRVAVLDHGDPTGFPNVATRVVLFEVGSGAGRPREKEIDGGPQRYGRITWLSDTELLFGSSGTGDHLVAPRLYDTELSTIAVLPAFAAANCTVRGGVLYALTGGELVSYPMPGGPLRALGRVGGGELGGGLALTGLAEPVEVAEAARVAPAPTFQLRAMAAEATPEPGRRRHLALVVRGVAALSVVSLAAFLLWRRSGRERPAT